MTYRDYRIGFSGTDLISPTQFEYYPELKYRMPQALAHALFAEAAPKLAERLIKLGLDERVKGYTAVSAISEAFKILQTGVVDQQQREQIEAIKHQLSALEGGTPNVIDV